MRKEIDFDSWLANELKDPKMREAYDELQPEFELLSAIIEARFEQGLSQQDISDLTGINRADISRIENGNANPTLKTMQKIAKALNRRLEIKFLPID